MKKQFLYAWISILTITPVLSAQASQESSCTLPSEQEVTALFERWNNSLKTGDAKAVAAHYSANAVLLPTLSNTPRKDDASRIDYFKNFLKKTPSGHIDSRTIKTGCNTALDTGTYTFTFGDNSKVQARYTFTYELIGNKWQITSHHSSAMPEKMASAM
ncbi:SgcJ/EcaC family oxidoreductase [Pseudomonas caspiana]